MLLLPDYFSILTSTVIGQPIVSLIATKKPNLKTAAIRTKQDFRKLCFLKILFVRTN